MKAAIEKIKAFFRHTKTDRRALYVFLFAALGLVLLDLGSKWLVQSFATPFSKKTSRNCIKICLKRDRSAIIGHVLA